MIEKIILDYLSQKLDCPVYPELPEKDIPKRYVFFERTSGGVNNHIKSATIALQSYADSLLEAVKLNEQVKQAMDALIELPNVSRSRLNSDYNYTDTTTKKYRYQAVYDLIYY